MRLYLLNEAKKRNVEITSRDSLRELANTIRKENKTNSLFAIMFNDNKKLLIESNNNLVVESIRNTSEIETLRNYCQLGVATNKTMKFYLLCVDAPIEIRYERVKKRKQSETDGDELDLSLFKKQEEAEMDSINSTHNLKQVINQANFLINNNKDLKHCYAQVDEIMKKLSTV